MDLGTQRPSVGQYDGRSVGELLTEISAGIRGRRSLTIDEWIAITAWADQNTIETAEGAATLVDGVIDTGVPIAGAGAPLVSEFALMELIAVLDRSPDGGRAYVGRIIECAWRLPRLYAAVVEGRVDHWRAERIADLTRPLPIDAAEFVDRQLNAAVGGVGWAQLERLVTEAILRFDPERAEAERQAANDHRRFDVHLDEIDQHGGVHIDGYLDAADGRDLHEAVARRAKLRGQLGDTDSLDVRRAKAAGELARQDLALDLLIADEDTGEVVAQSPGRRVELHVHITDTTLVEQAQGSRDGRCATSSTTGSDSAIFSTTAANTVGRCEELRAPVSVGQIKEWLRVPKTTVIVRPVIDLAECIPVDSYEIPDRHRRAVRLRDHTCRFPNCPKQATKCDLDHQTPHDKGGPTCPCNLVPLCRRHHRAKTFSLWRYVTIQPGHYLWISPNDRHFHVGPEGTRALDPPRRLDPDDY
ncbi:MAG TPA: hypothetical protein VNS46_09505 [Nocardioides sp.]|nr:hypothetical protein [Nocardioides sp.]